MSRFTQSEYQKALLALLPRGRVWQRNPDAVQACVLYALACSYAKNDTDAIALLVDTFPSTATGMLSEWEDTLGLPDSCAIGESDTIAKRRSAVVSKLISTGGQSVAYFVGVAEAMGYDITITEYRAARCGMSACGDAIYGDDWPFTWLVTAPTTTITYAEAGNAYCGDYIRSWGNKLLECRIGKLAPSHTIVKFGYEGATDSSDGSYDITPSVAAMFDLAMGYIPLTASS